MIFHTLPLTIKSVNNLPDKGEHDIVYHFTPWEEISSKTWSNGNTQKMLPTNCKNCGATLHGDTCEYCGTTYN